MSKLEELALMVGLTAVGLIWTIGAGDKNLAETRGREISLQYSAAGCLR